MLAPLGPWQAPSEALQACAWHLGRCAYRVGDPDRCDACHRLYATITGHDGETVAEHALWHARRDLSRDRKRRKASRAD